MPRPPRKAAAVAPDPDAAALPLGLDADPTPATMARRGPGRPRKITSAPALSSSPSSSSSGGSTSNMSIAQKRSKVKEEVRLYLILGQAAWELRDEECATALDEKRIDLITDKVMKMVSRSDDLVDFLARTGIIGDIVQLLAVVLPVARVVWRAHGIGGTGHAPVEPIDPNRYPAHLGEYAAR